MYHISALLLSTLLLACGADPGNKATGETVTATNAPQTMSFHELSATDIHGNPVPFDSFKGKKVLVVNTASECGYTKQYAQLQELHEEFKDKGLVVIGFPSNDFGGQEPGSESDIMAFCEKNFGVTFPMMSKVTVKGREPHPVYAWLTSKQANGVQDATVKWNFHKFLIDEQGRLVGDHPSAVSPLDEQIISWVEG